MASRVFRSISNLCTQLRGAGLFALLALCASPAAADRLTVYAAASLSEVLDRIADQYEEQSGHSVIRSYAGSSLIARQILLGAPADLFISANEQWMDHLEDNGHVALDGRQNFATNQLVLIAPSAAPSDNLDLISDPKDLAGNLADGFLAMALVEAVPAGIYGKAALEHFGLWDDLAMRVVQTDNVRAALNLVTLAEAKRGIVYLTDAMSEDRVAILGRFPASSHPLISYPAAALTGPNEPLARDFLDFLQGDEARMILVEFGFGPPGDGQ